MTDIFSRYIKSIVFGIIMLIPTTILADEQTSKDAKVNPDSITDENFVTASLLLMEPQNYVISSMGHICFRMQCPTYGMDYCFTYTLFNKRNEILDMLTGDLKMGMLRTETEQMLKDNTLSHRGVTEYKLNMPIKAKQNLWRILDERVDEGCDLNFDYDKRGCAHTALTFINMAFDTMEINTIWPDKFKETSRRKLIREAIGVNTWQTVILGITFGGSCNAHVEPYESVVIPKDLIEILQASSVNGTQLLSSQGTQLVKCSNNTFHSWFSPLVAAIIILLLTIVCEVFQKPYMKYALLTLQTVLGVLIIYIIAFTALPFTEWNWLIIPFNPLPALLWKWRGKWQTMYACSLLIWITAMFFAPYPQTEYHMIILTSAICAAYFHPHYSTKYTKNSRKLIFRHHNTLFHNIKTS